MIISLNPVAGSISDIPFPAVTICNMNQAKQSVVKNFEPGSTNNILLQSLCGSKHVNFTSVKIDKTNWPRFRKFLLEVNCLFLLLIIM